jgi:plasmid stabilization system protein ParE
MARVVVMPAAIEGLERLVVTHSLPTDTRERVRRLLRPLAQFPRLGASLEGRWSRFRFLLGPWRWLVIVYCYDEDADEVAVVAIQNGRSTRSASTPG